jgi:beta-1,2-mannosidase
MRLRASVLAVLFSAVTVHAQSFPKWVIGPFARPSSGNPVITPKPQSTFTDPILKAPAQWEALHTFNPAAIVRDNKVYVLYRAEDNSGTMDIGMHTSRLGLAESADGIHFARRAEPVFFPADDNQKAREWPGGVEDPRIVELEDGTYVLTYTQWNRQTYSVGIATSKDLEYWTKHGPAFFTAEGGKYADLKYKSAGIVTRLDATRGRLIAAKIDGKYWMYWGEGFIHLATSDDAISWTPVENAKGEPVELLRPRIGHFDSSFPETGPPPVLTDKGIVVLYNGKNAPSGGDPAMGPNAYAAGEALFDAQDPKHLIAQTDQPVLKPELPYEKTGQYAAGTTFAEGLVFFHGKWFLYYGCADSLVAVAMAPAEAPPANVSRGFYLHPDDTVVFYGDSITEQNYYNQWVELYTVTRFPNMRVHFFDAGVGGDRVTGGGGGPIDLRLQRDVFAEHPSVITIMLGMNDGGYQPTTPQIDATFRNGYEHILDSIKQNAPGARVTLLGPSPFDDVTAPPVFAGGYNSVMQHFADVDRDLAKEHGATFVNLNPPVVAALEKAQALDPRIAKLLVPDRVHPDPLAHWVMAEALLKGWNAPAVVSSVEIDAKVARATTAENAAVNEIARDGNGLRWTEMDNALPLPLTRTNAVQNLLFDLTDIEQALDQEPLRVTKLDAGSYALSIDAAPVGTFTAEQLANGINLAEYPTPMFHQAQRVSWMVRDRDEAHYIHLRMHVRNSDTGAEDGADRLQAFEDSLEDSIYAEAAPVPHQFELKPVTMPSTPGAQ